MLRNEDSKSTRDDIAKELTEVLVRIYNLASIPTISELKIKQYINSDIIEKAKYYGKSIQNKQQPDRIQPIISEFNVLFDVSSCKCLIQEAKRSKIIYIQLGLHDNLKNIVKQKRKEAQYEREEREMKRLHAVQPSQEFIECDFEEFESFDSSTSNTHKYTRNHNQLRNLAIMCDRYQISDRAGAAIANAVLQDYGIITQEEDSQIIDRNKLRVDLDSL
ncbi:hypothetical protein LOD99_552 [Oopsacas minuta]|uniref:Uncharacterized protein n=1 Tax=Oopsacas minuta TaxID=111878 RepID=A0AAV7KAG3_9METZ|nr:hypothetical protein LOD99_552 [Oopsacas minuta]